MLKKFSKTNSQLNDPTKIRGSENIQFKSENKFFRRVDINVLKARVQEVQNKEDRKNLLVLVFFMLLLGIIGIYLSI